MYFCLKSSGVDCCVFAWRAHLCLHRQALPLRAMLTMTSMNAHAMTGNRKMQVCHKALASALPQRLDTPKPLPNHSPPTLPPQLFPFLPLLWL